MPGSDREVRQHIVQIGQTLYQKGWVAANDGNISVKLDANRVLATPTGVSKGMMKPDDLIVVDMAGNKIEGTREKTTEIAMHLTIYEMRPDVRAVVHAHPPVATGFATAGRALNLALCPEVILSLGCVPLAEYGLPGTPELTQPMKAFIPTYDAILMGNHGVVAYGEDLQKAFFRFEIVEHTARIALVAELLGGARVLPRVEVDKLFESRGRYGLSSRTGVEAGCPVVAEDLSRSDSNRFWVSRDELIALVDEALKVRGAA